MMRVATILILNCFATASDAHSSHIGSTDRGFRSGANAASEEASAAFSKFWGRVVKATDKLSDLASERAATLQKQIGVETKQAGIYDTSALESRSLYYITHDDMWKQPVLVKEGPVGPIRVWKHWLPKSAHGSESSLVKTTGVVRATPRELFDLLFDSSRVHEYNKFSIGRSDIAVLDKRTKVVWNRTNPPGGKRPHDFVTIMHGNEFKNGTIVLVSTATEHSLVEPSENFTRSEIIFSVNYMRPLGPRLTELTTVMHVRTRGVPTFLVEAVKVSRSADFIQTVDEILKK